MARLILIRHAQPVVDSAVPSSHWSLSDAGRDAAKELAAELKPLGIQRVVASVEPKAWETGAIVAQRLGVPCSAWPGLHEHARDGAAYLPSRDEFERTIAALFARPDEIVYGSESAAAARDRFCAAVDEVLAEFPDQTIAIVTHGTVTSLFLQARAGVDPLPFWRALRQPDHVVLELPDFDLAKS
jgi:broad specificity phosphatase PhoE